MIQFKVRKVSYWVQRVGAEDNYKKIVGFYLLFEHNFFLSDNRMQVSLGSVAYLGFRKGGGEFLCPLVLTQRGPNQVFLFFPKVKFFFAKGGHDPKPPKYATDKGEETCPSNPSPPSKKVI